MSQPSKSIRTCAVLPKGGQPAADHALLAEFGNSTAFDTVVPHHLLETDSSAGAIARQLNGSLMALLLYMGEIKQQSDKIAQTPTERRYLQAIIDNAVEQTERVRALVRQMSRPSARLETAQRPTTDQNATARPISGAETTGGRQQKPLTPREREVLKLISEGHSNKEGALRMGISPRTFESHRAEAMRKLGARNTAELVRAALLHSLE